MPTSAERKNHAKRRKATAQNAHLVFANAEIPKLKKPKEYFLA
ncbi:hypothetical protein [Lutibacter sp.]